MTEAVDDWQAVGGTQAPAAPKDDWQTVGPSPEPPMPQPLPQAYVDRVAAGQHMTDALDELYKKPYSERLKEWTAGKLKEGNYPAVALGTVSTFLAGIPEMAVSGITAAKDVMDGKLVAGSGIRKQDYTDDPDAPDPLDALIARSVDMAMMVGGAPSDIPFAKPLVLGADGKVARPYTAPDGTARAQVVGSPPNPVDFKTAAQVLGGEHAEANLKAAWQQEGIHPAEAVHDAQRDVFTKHELTTEQEVLYHGSPYDFEAFDNSKIGSGEGAQSFAYGHYLAESPGVAKSYWTKLDETQSTVREFLRRNGGDVKAALQDWDNVVANSKAEKTASDIAMNDAVREEIANGGKGGLYTVKIKPERESFLQWETDLVDQPAGRMVLEKIDPQFRENLENYLEDHNQPALDELTGGMLHRLLERYASEDELPGVKTEGHPKREASEYIQSLGVPGVSFLDKNSRDIRSSYGDLDAAAKGDKPTRNFVVFSDKDMEITHKNGIKLGSVLTPADIEVLTETGGKPASLSAAVTDPPIDIPLKDQPAPPPGSLSGAFQAAGDKLFDLTRDAQRLTAPMAMGTTESMAIAKDFANTVRRNRWEWGRIDDDVMKRFTPEQRERMWNAADEESVMRQEGQASEHMGLATLEPAERAAVEDLQSRAQNAWLRARDLGMVEGEGLPAYTPRMVINAAGAAGKEGPIPLNGMGDNLRTRTGNMLRRKYLTAEETEAAAKAKYGPEATLARDIRTLPLATAHLEDAIAGRQLINAIKDYGKRTGTDTVAEGAIPEGSATKWFTIDHPAFKTWRPKFEEKAGGGVEVLKDAEGNPVFEQVPLYVHGDFEGPLRAVLSQRSGALYQGMMSLKGKTMSLIMNSPLIHNAVEWGRALPAMPGKVASLKVYFEGNRAKNDVATMREAIDAGMVPIGKRFFNQDITSVMETPDLTPGRSFTAKVLAAVPGLFDEAAGTAVKRAVDKAGDFWHNTLLWDRIGDLQAGLYVNFRDSMVAKGVDNGTAAKIAAHFANRYAGALPMEAMSDGARKVANLMMFSRTFTLGNIGAIKDMITGLPRDVLAQIERDAGFRAGALTEAGTAGEGAAAAAGAEAVQYAKTMARRKAMAVIAMDIGLFYVGNSILQSGLNVMLNDSTLEKELHGYVQRLQEAMKKVGEHPLSLLQPLGLLEGLSATGQNEPGRQDRLFIGNAKDGTAIYARNPAGKIGEEFLGYMTGPLDMMRRKMGTIARPMWQILSNDKGFGRKIYDPDADTPMKYAANVAKIVKHLVLSQTPEGQMNAFGDLVKGDGDPKVNALQALGPLAGITFSKGAPGGPAVGEMYKARAMHDYEVQTALPDIRKQIQRGDIAGATQRMNELNIPAGLQRFYIRTSVNPSTRLSAKALRDFYLYATPEQRARMERFRAGSPMAPSE